MGRSWANASGGSRRINHKDLPMSYAIPPISTGVYARRLGTALCLALVLAACGGSGSNPSVPPAGSTAEEKQVFLASKIDAVLASKQNEAEPGLSIIVVKNGVVTYSRSKGMANIARASAITENTVFELASLTKPITALAVMQLRDANLLSLSDPVTKWLPQLPPAWSGITIHQLLSHQSGIRDYTNRISSAEAALLDGLTNDDLLARFAANGQLEFAPGTKAEYSNSNYLLLAEIIVRASGRSYAQYVQEHVFTPLGMRSTYVSGNPAPQPGAEALNFGRLDKPNPFNATFATVGAIGVHSSAADLALFVRALDAGQIVPMTTLASMTSVQSRTAVVENGDFYGYGWLVAAKGAPLTLFGHSGRADGFRNAIRGNHEKGVYFIILTNGGDVTESISTDIGNLVKYAYD